MNIAYFDCIAGASGDMILGALIDAGVPQKKLRQSLTALHLQEFDLKCRTVTKNGFTATKVDVIIADKLPERHLAEIETIVRKSDLPEEIQVLAMTIFEKLCQVEAGIHGTTVDKVHLHELGGVDTIVDVVGALAGLRLLNIDRMYASPLPVGRGFITGAHGQIPLPAPATAALLKGVPIKGIDLDVELVTPTGAVLLTSLVQSFGAIPEMTIKSIGYGAGGRDLPIPNVMRLFIGEKTGEDNISTETLTLLETNIDDLNPEIYEYVMARLFENGALDVYFTPIQMKKNRPGISLHVLCEPSKVQTLEAILFSETSTFGIRHFSVLRDALKRSFHTIKTVYGEVRIKAAQLGEKQTKISPEYEDCRRLAELHNVPLQEIYATVEKTVIQTDLNKMITT